MALFHRDEDKKRKILGLVVAMAAHVERNTPEVFPKATTDRLEDAADELLSDDPISFETKVVVQRMLSSLAAARNPNRLWGDDLIDALKAIDEEEL